MQAMPAFLWNKRRIFVSHRRSFGREKSRSRLALLSHQEHNGHGRQKTWLESVVTFVDVMREIIRCWTLVSADAECNILHRPGPRGNRDSDRLARWRRRPRSDEAFRWGCASRLQNVFAVSKRHAGDAPDE